MGILVNSDGSMTPSCLFFIVGIPLVAIGIHHQQEESMTYENVGLFNKPLQLVLGLCFITLAVAIPLLESFLKWRGNVIGKENNLKYMMLPAEAIVDELKRLESDKKKVKSGPAEEKVAKSIGAMSDAAILAKSLQCIDALVYKCGQAQPKKGKNKSKKKKDKPQSDERNTPGEQNEHGDSNGLLHYESHGLETLCQEAAYIVLRLHPSNDKAVNAAIALLAVIAGDPEVRRRHYEEADKFGLDVPIRAMRDSLSRSKLYDDPPEDKERFCAELQRKGCLWVGALADEDKDIATKMVDEEGLQAVLDATEWYRHHEDVANWALWSIFILCYEHMGNKQELIRMNGIQRICRVMKNVPNCPEVARHGIGTLFDLLRQVPGSVKDVSQIRMIALNAGIHDVVKNAMVNFPKSLEIVMMGQQMLIATGYQGDIPQYEGNRNH
mmetsp:Transcript_68436/g.101634  ORF Transcript_68436/g.101634 Transcript_68436/m.101634 type:complete len:439 (+) Transcript_68436:89-1405(+)